MYNHCDFSENKSKSVETLAGTDYFVSEKGDVSRPKSAGVKNDEQSEKKSKIDKNNIELFETPSPFRIVSERTPLMDLSGLLHITPEPLPSLRNMQTCKL